MSGLGIDIRSDIYSLGVLLYELMTGKTPLESKRLLASGYNEMLRIIREEEPPRPSTKVSSLGQEGTVIAEHRRTDPKTLSRSFKGELDWIAMKALEKDRERRYDTANSFAADIQHFLDDEAVLACPPSTTYRIRKFVRRNRAPVSAAAVLLSVLCLGLVGTSIGLLRASHEARRAQLAEHDAIAHANLAAEEAEQRQQANQKLQEANQEISEFLLHQAFVYAMSGDQTRTNELIDKLTLLATSESEIEMVKGMLIRHTRAGYQGKRALEHYQRATELDGQSVAAWSSLAAETYHLQTHGSDEALRKATELSPTTSVDYLCLGLAHLLINRSWWDAIPLLERSLEEHDSGIAHLCLASTFAIKAAQTRDNSEMRRAEKQFRTARSLTGSTFIAALHQMHVFDLAGHLAQQLNSGQREIERLTAVSKEAAAVLDKEIGAGRTTRLNHYLCAMHFDLVEGDSGRADAHWQRVVEERGWNAFHYAAFLLKHEGIDRALELLSLYPESRPELASKAMLLALTPAGYQEARHIWDDELKEDAGPQAFVVPILLGDLEVAEEACLKYLEVPRDPYQRLLAQYLLGNKDEADLLQGRELVKDQARAEAQFHYLNALRALAPDVADLTKAKEEFQLCVETAPFGHLLALWSRGILAQMERDPAWLAHLALNADE